MVKHGVGGDDFVAPNPEDTSRVGTLERKVHAHHLIIHGSNGDDGLVENVRTHARILLGKPDEPGGVVADVKELLRINRAQLRIIWCVVTGLATAFGGGMAFGVWYLLTHAPLIH